MEKSEYSTPAFFAIFFNDGENIIHNGTRFCSLDELKLDFPNAAILPKDEVPKDWRDMQVVNGFLKFATKEVLASREKLVVKNSAKLKMEEILLNLKEMDYKTSKYLDGEYTPEEWEVISDERKALRKRYKELELIING